jgi:hypothetical protein
MLKIRMMCLYVLLAGNVNATDIMNGLFDQVSGLFVRSAVAVIERDIEAGVFEEIGYAERLTDRMSDEVVCEPKVMIDGMQYVKLSNIDKIRRDHESQVTYASYALSVLKKCTEGDRKAIATLVTSLLATHGFIKLFI